MMVTAVYLSGKLGQVTGQGFGVLREQLPRWLIHCILAAVLVGNTIEAGAVSRESDKCLSRPRYLFCQARSQTP
jgi:hypothetical protein